MECYLEHKKSSNELSPLEFTRAEHVKRSDDCREATIHALHNVIDPKNKQFTKPDKKIAEAANTICTCYCSWGKPFVAIIAEKKGYCKLRDHRRNYEDTLSDTGIDFKTLKLYGNDHLGLVDL
jgi:hypothetical protein